MIKSAYPGYLKIWTEVQRQATDDRQCLGSGGQAERNQDLRGLRPGLAKPFYPFQFAMASLLPMWVFVAPGSYAFAEFVRTSLACRMTLQGHPKPDRKLEVRSWAKLAVVTDKFRDGDDLG
jgi:hypothetical protein